ncbi:MAG: pyrimidine-nucleoside phosphorylase [Spirochaetes bacterium]|nr:MAG: pyrimidine-nucleoside phosphorylase [Spirochaetota bacterium]
MRITDIIYKKRSGKALSPEEIEFFIRGYVKDEIPDYQISALLMAIWFQGMNKEETIALTHSMVRSGERIDLSDIPGIKADKHSTGGVSDTTTLIVAPVVAACGGKVAKISGRGLGHTGGTLDKLESIPGLSTGQTMERFKEIVSKCGCAVVGATADLVPADKKLYALRDVTVTIDNLSLIASSVMSKKIAAGCDVIVLDVKTGNGAFMKDPALAVELAQLMVEIGKSSGKKTSALITDMNQPLGNAVGNALEVEEAIRVLSGEEDGDLKKVSLALASRMLVSAGLHASVGEAETKLEEVLANGRALETFACMIEAQGGSPDVVENTKLLPQAEKKVTVTAENSGYIYEINAFDIGLSAMLLGAGRGKKEDTIDPAVGIWMKKRYAEEVEKGEELAVFHVNQEKNLDEAIYKFKKAITISGEKPQPRDLIYSSVE